MTFKKKVLAGLAAIGASAPSFAALPDSTAMVSAISADAASAAGIGAAVLAVVMPLSIGFTLLVKFIRKGTQG